MDEIRELLNLNENYEIEFKKCGGDKLPDSFWETYSSFANTLGGVVILGYEEKTKTITGVDNPDKIIDDLFTMANDQHKTNRNLLTNDLVKTYNINGRNLIKITVHEASYTQKPVFIKGDIKNTYIRRNSTDTRATHDDLRDLFSSSREETDGELIKNFDISDFNVDSIEAYRSELISKTAYKHYMHMTHEEFLKEIGAFKRDRNGDGKYRPTKGSLLLFGKYNSIIDIFPSFQLDYFEKNSSDNRWDDRVSTGDMAYSDINNIYDFYKIVIKKLQNSSKDTFLIDEETKQRLPFKKDLEESIREALVNSLMHALYDSDFPIKITVFPDYYEFENPGQMRVTLEEFISGKTSRIRNHVIANLFRKVGISEKAASGGLKIYNTAQKYNLKSPELVIAPNKTIIRIWKIDITHNFKDLSELEYDIMMYVLNNGFIKKSILIDNFSLSDQKIRTILEKLVKKDYLIKVGKSRATKYVLPYDAQENYLRIKKLLKIVEDSINHR
jgi:divergent AAA domain protein